MSSFLIILIFSYCSFLQAEENIIDGLLFNSIYDYPEGRNKATSLTIPSNDAISYENNLTIEFDIFFWRKSPFGFILSGGNKQDPNLFVLSYSDYKSQDTSFIELTYADRPSIISIPILDVDQGWGKWKKIKLYFELEKQRVGLSYQNQNIIWHNGDMQVSNQMQFDFGSTSFVVEPPRMAIKNIYINKDDKKSILWKLNEEVGKIAHPNHKSENSLSGMIVDGVWIKELHRSLKPLLYHEVYQNNFQFLGVDNDLNQFIYLMNDSLFYYDKNIGQFVGKHSFPYLTDDNYIYRYNPVEKLIFATPGGGGGPICYLDLKKNTWDDYAEGYESDGLFFTSNFLYDYLNKDIYTIGGYGWYEQKNILQKYNSQNSSWSKIKYKTIDGNLFFPRCKSAIAYDKENNQFFLYGGQGNESGKQQQGFRELNDLWVIDLKNYEFNQIWEDSSQKYYPYEKHQKVTISSEHKKIYKAFGGAISNKSSALNKTGYLEILVSTFESRDFKKFIIDYNEDQNNKIELLYIKALDATDELLVVYQIDRFDNKSVVFSTIKTPLIPPYEEKTSYAEIIILTLIGFGILVFVFTTRFGVEDKKTFNKIDSLSSITTEDKLTLSKGLSIKLLNSFEIMNQGKKITTKDWKSRKARNLFIFIILKRDDGASINEIHNLFWPDVNKESARNSRAVALSRVRSVISPYDNLLTTKEDIVRFKGNNDVFIDFYYLDHLINFSIKEDFNSLGPLKLIDSGKLFNFSNANWVEPFRIEVHEKIIKYAKDSSKIFIKEKRWDELGFVGNKLLALNCFNDDGMRYAVLANKMLNKNALSHKVYLDFTENYELKIGEKYPTSYDNVLLHYKME